MVAIVQMETLGLHMTPLLNHYDEVDLRNVISDVGTTGGTEHIYIISGLSRQRVQHNIRKTNAI